MKSLKSPVFNVDVYEFKDIVLLHQEKRPGRDLLENLNLVQNSFNSWFNSPFFAPPHRKLNISRVVGLNKFENSKKCSHTGTFPNIDINPSKIFDFEGFNNELNLVNFSIADNTLMKTSNNISFKNYRIYDLALMDESLLVHVELENNCMTFPFYVFNTWLILNYLIDHNGKYARKNIEQFDSNKIYTPSINLFLPGIKGLIERSILIGADDINLNYIYNGAFQDLLPELDGKSNFIKMKIDQVFLNVQAPALEYSSLKYLLVKQYKKSKLKNSLRKVASFLFKHSKFFMLLSFYINSLELIFYSKSNLRIKDQLALRSLVRWKKYQL